MKQLAIITLLLLAACSPAVELEAQPTTPEAAPEVSNEELEGIDDIDAILDDLDDLDLNLDDELAALDEDLQ